MLLRKLYENRVEYYDESGCVFKAEYKTIPSEGCIELVEFSVTTKHGTKFYRDLRLTPFNRQYIAEERKYDELLPLGFVQKEDWAFNLASVLALSELHQIVAVA